MIDSSRRFLAVTVGKLSGHRHSDGQIDSGRDNAAATRPRLRGHRVKRRDLLAVAAGIALVRVPSVRGQTRLPTIGYLSSSPPDIPVGEVADFKAGLAEAGIAEGRDVVIDYRF